MQVVGNFELVQRGASAAAVLGEAPPAAARKRCSPPSLVIRLELQSTISQHNGANISLELEYKRSVHLKGKFPNFLSCLLLLFLQPLSCL
jgi:hypothetical protein